MRDEILSAVRQWRRAPGANAVTVLSLTLGMGGTLALFSLVDAVLLQTSHALWQRDYGGRPDIISHPIYLNNHRFDIRNPEH